ncbi:MAG TPA: hypothetical protein VIF12_08705 [Micavibrio sp.]
MKAKAGTPEEIERYHNEGKPPSEPTAVEKKIREWAEGLISAECKALDDAIPQTLCQALENKKRESDLSAEFRKMADPTLNGTIAAVKIIYRHYLNRILPQPS